MAEIISNVTFSHVSEAAIKKMARQIAEIHAAVFGIGVCKPNLPPMLGRPEQIKVQ